MENSLHDELSMFINDSPPVIKKMNDQGKYLKSLKETMCSKKDQAVSALNCFVSETVQALKELEKHLTGDIEEEFHKQVILIDATRELILHNLRATAAAFYRAESLLEEDGMIRMSREGPPLVKELTTLLSKDHLHKAELIDLEFIPSDKLLSSTLPDTSVLGHIRKDKRHELNNLEIYGNDEFHVDCEGTLKIVCCQFGVDISPVIDNPRGEIVNHSIEECKDGSYLISVTPKMVGIHRLVVNPFGGNMDSPHFFIAKESEKVKRRRKKAQRGGYALFSNALKEVKGQSKQKEPRVLADCPHELTPTDRSEKTRSSTDDRTTLVYTTDTAGDSTNTYAGNKNSYSSDIEYHTLQHVPALDVNENDYFTPLDRVCAQGKSNIRAEFVRQIGRRGTGNTRFERPIGVTISPNSHVIVCDNGNDAVKVFEWNGTFKFSLGETGDHKFRRPSAVVCNIRGDIYVKDDAQIHVFDKYGTFIRAFGKDLKKPFGLVRNKYGDIMVLDQNYANPPAVAIYQEDGALLKKTNFKPLKSRDWSHSKCRFMHAHGENELYIVDLGTNFIYKSTLKGKEVEVIGKGLGKELGYFNDPSGITGDSSGNILIADSRNHRIQILSKTGEFIGIVKLSEPCSRPSDIHLTDDNFLCVVNYWNHCVNIYKLV